MDAISFVKLVKSRHPELVTEINRLDPEPNTTLTCGALKRAAQHAIDESNAEAVTRYFETALIGWDDGNSKVQNSIGLSFLRPLNFKDQRAARAWAWNLLHPRLQAAASTAGNGPARPR